MPPKTKICEPMLTQEREVVDQRDGWIFATIQTLKKASPTSLKISLRSVS